MGRRLLLDENLCHELKSAITSLEVQHQEDLGWKSLSNGKLLRAAEENGFDYLVTGDKNMPYQQNIEGRSISLIVLSIHPRTIGHQLSCAESIKSIAVSGKPGNVYVVKSPFK